MPATTTRTIEALNALLRSAIAATETYEIAIRKIERHGDANAVALRVIRQDHLSLADRLRREVLDRGGEPDETSGAWGLLARTVENATTLLGDGAAVRALKEGERHAISAALAAVPLVEGALARNLQDVLLPSLVQHLDLLDNLIP